MRIVYIIEDFSIKGGAERIVSEKASTLADDYGHEVTIVSIYKDKRPPSYPVAANVKIISLDIPFPNHEGNAVKRLINRFSTLIHTVKKLNATLAIIKPDATFFTMVVGALALPFAKNAGKRIYESHSARKFTPFHNFFFMMERHADTVVCLTEDDAQEYRHAKHCVVIPNFIEEPCHTVKDYSKKSAIAVGRLEEVKGFDRLIKMWKTIALAHPDWHLDIYGDGTEKDRLQERINKYNLSDKITLCGRSDNIQERYAEHSLHVMSSRYEGLGMVMIEANACGLPSVSFNFEYGASDILKDGENGLLVPQNDREMFIKAVEQLMDNENLRATMGKKAAIMAHRYYKENIIEKWNRLLDGIMRRQ